MVKGSLKRMVAHDHHTICVKVLECDGVRSDLLASLAALRSIPTGLQHSAQGCEARATLGMSGQSLPTPTGLQHLRHACGCNPVGVEEKFHDLSQGSSYLATLGCTTESRWDSAADFRAPSPLNGERAGVRGENTTRAALRAGHRPAHQPT